jgi:hypothetical protein
MSAKSFGQTVLQILHTEFLLHFLEAAGEQQ